MSIASRFNGETRPKADAQVEYIEATHFGLNQQREQDKTPDL